MLTHNFLSSSLPLGVAIFFVTALVTTIHADEKPIAATEAVKRVNQEVYVEMKVETAKDRLAERGVIYLDSEDDFKDPKNLGVVITKKGAESLREKKKIDKPADHFRGKKIRAKGKVILVDELPRIEIEDADLLWLADEKK